ncbi:MAG: hypothetical protein CL609_24205 [Anaerolineaceae bacterium]|nr:hypothetical protein [Anaerolineaceae bacterium]
MNDYEDVYLRDKVKQIIAKQREGNIVISAYKDGSGLPTRDDLGRDLSRATYPYDYKVGKAGYLNYNSELGAYLFIAIPGEKLPSALVNYRPLMLAEANLDIQGRRITIQNGETHITFTGVQPWKGLYEVLREINEELTRINAGVVIWKISISENIIVQPSDRLFSEAVPKLRNGQALAHVTGYAYDSDHNLAYIGMVGYKTSLDSLRATLMCGKQLQMSQDGMSDITLLPTEKYEQAWLAMPEYTSHHVGFVSRLALSSKWEPEDQRTFLLVFRETPDPRGTLIQLFVDRIKEALEVPILDEWAATLWHHARNHNLVQNLVVGGDCVLGASIDLQADWKEFLSELFTLEEISLTV